MYAYTENKSGRVLEKSWEITNNAIEYIYNSITSDDIILELGSGESTKVLSQLCTVYSVEESSVFLNQYHNNYIYAPIKSYGSYNWYDVEILEDKLPKDYDVLLIDGPIGNGNRIGFLNNIHLFNLDCIIVMDDINERRTEGIEILKKISELVKRPYKILDEWTAVIE
jgi:hypothetical protein